MTPETINSSIHEGLHLATSDIHFARIVVGTDFSEPAPQALKMAIGISDIFGSEIFLVNAVTPFMYGAAHDSVTPELLQAELDNAGEEMKKLVASNPRLNWIWLKTTVARADAVDLILQVASEEKADLIVVGSHGASGLEKLLLGSVAETVLRKASCPVLVVGPHCRTEINQFRSILFATDLITTGLRAAQYASSLSKRVHGRLTLLHVVERRPSIAEEDPELIEKCLEQHLQRLLPAYAEVLFTPKSRLEYGSPAEVIPAVARSESASLVVVGTRAKSALAEHRPWSTLSHIIREANCGVLAVRAHLR